MEEYFVNFEDCPKQPNKNLPIDNDGIDIEFDDIDISDESENGISVDTCDNITENVSEFMSTVNLLFESVKSNGINPIGSGYVSIGKHNKPNNDKSKLLAEINKMKMKFPHLQMSNDINDDDSIEVMENKYRAYRFEIIKKLSAPSNNEDEYKNKYQKYKKKYTNLQNNSNNSGCPVGKPGPVGYIDSDDELEYAAPKSSNGCKGQKGVMGCQGQVGYELRGPTGAVGCMGNTGVPKPYGVAGQKGDMGFSGLQGIPGPAESVIYDNSRGPSGTNGSQNNMTSSYNEILSYINVLNNQTQSGSQGNIGPVGPVGIPGPIGDGAYMGYRY